MPDLRPLGFGEILDVGIKLYLRHWRPLMLCTVGLILPVQIISVLVLLSAAPEALDPTTTEPVDPDDANAFLAATVVTSVLTMIVYLVASVACFKAVADGYLGAQPSARRSLAFAVRALPRLLLLGLIFVVAFVAVVALIAGIAALVLPLGVILGIAAFFAYVRLAVSFSLTIPSMLFERTMPWTALGRSFRLVKGRWWSVFGIIVVGIVLVSFLAGLLQGAIQIVPAVLADGNDAVLAFSTVVGQTVGYTLTTPFTAAVLALLYFDQRVRKEGFDLELLASTLQTA